MSLYRSCSTYEALQATTDNTQELESWGWIRPMPPDGTEDLWVIRDSQSQMISAVLHTADFNVQFEVVPDPEPDSGDPPVVDSP